MSKSELFKIREQRIQQAALDTAQKTGALEFRMADVAQAAECSVGTIYGHFLSKEDLMASLIENSLAAHQKWVQKLEQGNLDNLTRFLVMLWGDHKRLIREDFMFSMEQLICNTELWLRVSDNRQRALKDVLDDNRAKLAECLHKTAVEQGLSLNVENIARLVEQIQALLLGRELQFRFKGRSCSRDERGEIGLSLDALEALLSGIGIQCFEGWRERFDHGCDVNPLMAPASEAPEALV